VLDYDNIPTGLLGNGGRGPLTAAVSRGDGEGGAPPATGGVAS